MSILSRLFGGKDADKGTASEPVEHGGFRIYPEPIKEGGEYRVAARIELGDGDAVKMHQLVRADTLNNLEDATAASLRKAKQVIDEQGEQIFG